MRKTKELKINVPDKAYRDNGKVFLLREMSAADAESWAARAMEAMSKSGADVPEYVLRAGLAGLYNLGIRAFLGAPHALVKPLLDEMFEKCVSVVPDPKRPNVIRGGVDVPGYERVGPMVDDDTEEVHTRLLIRSEVFELHTGFSVAAYLTQMWEEAKAAAEAVVSSANTQMSGPTSASSPPAA